jgi:hypothetical protein
VVITFSSFRSSELSSPSEVFLPLSAKGATMPFQAILKEVTLLNNVGTRLEDLAEQHPAVSEALIRIAGSIRSAASLLAVVVATKVQGIDGDTLPI